MKMLQLSDKTIRMARRAGLPLVRTGDMAPDRTWSVPVSGEVAQLVEDWRVRGEHDDGVVQRVTTELTPYGRQD